MNTNDKSPTAVEQEHDQSWVAGIVRNEWGRPRYPTNPGFKKIVNKYPLLRKENIAYSG